MNKFNFDQKSAAQQRRSLAKREVAKLVELLNIDAFLGQNISDDVTVLRLAYNYIQMKQCVRNVSGLELFKSSFINQQYHDLDMTPINCTTRTKSLEDIFFKTHNMASFIVLTLAGDVMFASNKIPDITGIPLNEFIGENIFDYIHPVDSMELAKLLNPTAISSLSEPQIKYNTKISVDRLLMNSCDILKNSKNVSNYRHINMNVRFKYVRGTKKYFKFTFSSFNTANLIGTVVKSDDGLKSISYFTGFLVPLFTPTVKKFTLLPTAYVSQNDLGLSFLWCSDSLLDFFRFYNVSIASKSLYVCVNFGDLLKLKAFHKEILEKCHVVSSTIRLRSSNGQLIACKLRGHLVYNNNEPHHIVCVYFPLRIYNDEDFMQTNDVIASTFKYEFKSLPTNQHDKNEHLYETTNQPHAEPFYVVRKGFKAATIPNTNTYTVDVSSSSSMAHSTTNSPNYKAESYGYISMYPFQQQIM